MAFVVYVATLNVDLGNKMHPSKKAQIAYLKVDKVFIKAFSKYADFANIFLLKLAVKLSKYIKINNHAIELINDQQSPYNFIYSLNLIELEKLKIYIKNNLANSFIRHFESRTRAPIFFDKMLNKSLQLYIYYQSLNNL